MQKLLSSAFSSPLSSACGASNFFRKPEIQKARKEESPWKKHKIGRERPHFFGFEPPKKFLGSLPPSGTEIRARCFFHGDQEFGERTKH